MAGTRTPPSLTPVRIDRDGYTYRGVPIERGTVVGVTPEQLEAMTADTPPNAVKVPAEEAKRLAQPPRALSSYGLPPGETDGNATTPDAGSSAES